MAIDQTEKAFEAAIEHSLTTSGGYEKGDRDTFDRERGLDPGVFLAFVQETQPDEWQYLEDLQKDKAEGILLEDLCRALSSQHEGCCGTAGSRLPLQVVVRRVGSLLLGLKGRG